MKVVIAIDSLKGSLSSIEAGIAVKDGVFLAKPDAKVIVRPLADGGEGTTDALIEGMNGERIDLTVTGPMHTPVNAYYGYLKDTGTAVMEMASAAGGLGFAFLSYLGASLTPGVQLILNTTGLEQELSDADVVVTGEGRLDFQTAMGKAPIGVAKLAKKHHAKVIAFAGSVTEEATACNKEGIDAFFPILRSVCTLAEAMDPANAKANLTATAQQVFRLL